MRDRPPGVSDADVVAALAREWRIGARSVTYRPVGAGSYHWAVVDRDGPAWFVTVDDLGADDRADGGREAAFGTLARAYETARVLRHDAGLDFVVAPVATADGAAVARLNPRYAVAVFPMVDGAAGQFGAHRVEDRAEVARLLAHLHRATQAVAGRADRAELVLPGRDRLDAALNDLDREWTGGPYAEPTRRLLAARADDVTRSLVAFDELAGRVRAADIGWVVTHGEPHPGNVIRGRRGLSLIDWDTVRIAPPERDLWMIAGPGDALFPAGPGPSFPVGLGPTTGEPAGPDGPLAEYARITGRAANPAGLALYRLWWQLADIADFVAELRRPHRATGDSTASWSYLRGYLA